jgi:sugar transferase EpsL
MMIALMKRLFDLAIAVGLTVLLSPLMLVIAILVWAKLGRPVLFKQMRPGLHGTPFMLYKFRTMNDRRDHNGALQPDHARLTDFGIFLRK